MKYDYDLICIGLGPAGMAVSVMAHALGLRVLAIERRSVGGECMNVGCIPSKGILRYAARQKNARDFFKELALPHAHAPFEKIREHLRFIGEKKTMTMFEKIPIIFGEATFADAHTVSVNGEKKSARKIFIATGTRPAIPNFLGAESVDFLTNETIFSLDAVPASLIVFGGGAIACELAQAFARLGSAVTLVQRSPHILSKMDPDAAALVEKKFREEGIRLLTGTLPASVRNVDGQIELTTTSGEIVRAEKILAAAGRRFDFSSLKLDNAGVALAPRGNIRVNDFLQTSQPHIYAVGDCNGEHLFSHAAMHQGMIALMNAMLPRPFRKRFRKYVVPATMFTSPQVSEVGARERALRERGIVFETVVCRYSDYGAAIAEEIPDGFVKAFVGRTGRILGASIVGENSGEMINEWALAVQKKMRITDLLFLQHSFPTMGFLSKRIAETWTMKRAENPILQRIARAFFRF